MFTADLTAESGGCHVMTAWTLADHDRDPRSWGTVLETGFFVAPDVALNMRGVFGQESGTADDLLVVTTGVTWFVHGHDLRVSMDAGYSVNPVTPNWADSAAGWRESDAGQVVLRGQVQLLF